MANFDTIKTAIDANIKTNGNQMITGEVLNSVLTLMNRVASEVADRVSVIDDSLDIYRDGGEDEIYITPTNVQGRVGVSDSLLVITASNWDSYLYPVKAGQQIYVRTTVAKVFSPNYASVAFIPAYEDGVKGEVIRDLGTTGTFTDTYTPTQDGYILVLHTITQAVYVSESKVYRIERGVSLIDFATQIASLQKSILNLQGVIGDMEDLNSNVKADTIVEAINLANQMEDVQGVLQRLSVYEETTESMLIENGEGQYRATLSSATLDEVGNNYIAAYYKVQKGQRLHITITNLQYNGFIFALVYFQAGSTIKPGGQITVVQPLDKVGNYDIQYIVPEDGYVFVQKQIISSWGYEVRLMTPTGEFIDFKKMIDDLSQRLEEKDVQIQKEVDLLKDRLVNPTLHLPATIYAVVGDTLQIFFRSVVNCQDLKDYDVHVISNKGKSYPRYYQFQPTNEDVGSHEIELVVRDHMGNVLASKQSVIITSAKPSSPNVQKNIAIFGDSLTTYGEWVSELARRLNSADADEDLYPAGLNLSNISFVGTMKKNSTGYYGIGGWAWVNYATQGTRGWRFYVSGVSSIAVGAIYAVNGKSYIITEANITSGSGSILAREYATSGTPPLSGTLTLITGMSDREIVYDSVEQDSANPLWNADTSSVSYTPYIAECTENNNVDLVVFLLGWNILYVDLTPNEEYIRTLLTTLHSEFPSCKVVIMGVQLPSLNGGLGDNYAPSFILSDPVEVVKLVHAYNEFLKNVVSEYTYATYIDVASQFDSENNMPEVEVNVNSRNPKKELRGSNGIHPSLYGYLQIADVLYRYLADWLNS